MAFVASVDAPSAATVHGLVDQAALRSPDACAIVADGVRITYRNLVAAADDLAASLRHRGVTVDSRVVVAVHRSALFVVVVLAILKAGAAYVPVDPAYPADRQMFMVEDCGADLIIAESDDTPLADKHKILSVDALSLDKVTDLPGKRQVETEASADDLAYLIYTSGSTGTPKGVEITHADVVNLLTADPRLAVAPGSVVAHLAPTAFDASTFEIWSALAAGATLAILTERHIGITEVAEALRNLRPDWLFLTSGLFHMLVGHEPDALRCVGVLLTGGDVLSPRHVRTASTLVRDRVYAAYGPTEGTVFTSLHEATADTEYERVPLGRPLRGKTMCIVDGQLNELPAGQVGEICLGGAGVSRGYHRRPELNAQRFATVPSAGPGGRRLYRTGDLGRVLPTGEIEFHGRMDRQVKIRGFRVEPGEIEAALQSHPDVRAAAAVVTGDGDLRRLIAYVSVRSSQVDGGVLRVWLARRLPVHLQPNSIIVLDELPLDPNGKLDRAALPASWKQRDSLHGFSPASFVEPVTSAQVLIAGVFQDALQIDRVGINDSFFELGGDSLRGAMALQQLRAFEIRITARQFYQGPTVAGIALLAGSGHAEVGE